MNQSSALQKASIPSVDKALRHDRHVAELPKMIVKRHGGADAQIVDDDRAGTVGEAPASGGALLEENPGALNLTRRDAEI